MPKYASLAYNGFRMWVCSWCHINQNIFRVQKSGVVREFPQTKMSTLDGRKFSMASYELLYLLYSFGPKNINKKNNDR